MKAQQLEPGMTLDNRKITSVVNRVQFLTIITTDDGAAYTYTEEEELDEERVGNGAAEAPTN